MRKCGGDGPSGDECEEEQLLSSAVASPTIPLGPQRGTHVYLHSAVMYRVWARQRRNGKKNPLFFILHFFYWAFCELASSVFADVRAVWRPKTLVRRGLFFSFKWQRSLKCDEKTLNLAQNLRRGRTAGRRGRPNTQPELRSQRFSSLTIQRTQTRKRTTCRWLFLVLFFFTNSSV